MLECNADTPTVMLEAGPVQANWLGDRAAEWRAEAEADERRRYEWVSCGADCKLECSVLGR